MSKAEKTALKFRIAGIRTDEFAILEENYNEKDPIKLTSEINFGLLETEHVLGISLSIRFEQDSKPFIKLAVSLRFEMEEKSWALMVNKEKQEIIIPLDFASHMGVIAVGTMRGILYEKLTGSRFAHFILPPIDLTRLIRGDATLPLVSLQNSETRD
ncbi:hypothetical protein CYPRO_3318 [Cyclonatronum proteinivorum]|uniref:Preprotein translocase subunit SecB n=1 Tax=Cyclonatronum proteinivorum TaxID=1457365 RepID=A0A345UPZ9_9BACT|nr:hypothetical protein [Cyclonatronum proteinivorum]AXJ02551.1 hypothetical protein CYPRO_3318 [Cyclonatronum proteinivorum]